MAGVEGQVTAILTDETLMIERVDRKGMKIELDSISRLRHHHVAFTPPLLTLFGILAIFGSVRIFTGQMQIYTFILGISSLLAWVIGRRPTLSIDTKAGDRHLLHGRDHLLQRMYMILDRISDGMTLEDAVIGLKQVEQAELALLGDLAEIRNGAGDVATANAELFTDTEVSLEEALANIREGKSAIPTMMDSLPSPPQEEPQFAHDSTPQNSQPTPWNIPQPTGFMATDGPSSQSTTMIERSTRALAEQKVTSTSNQIGYDTPFQLPTFGIEPESASSVPVSTQPLSRAAAAASEASEANFDSGGLFSMFDDLDDTTPSHVVATLPPPQPISSLPARIEQPGQNPSESGSSSYSMLVNAAGPNLPEPTNYALRSDLPVGPGLVASAAVSQEKMENPLPEQLQKSFAKITEPAPLAGYPALSRMAKQFTRDSRIRVDRPLRRRKGAVKTITEWVRPGLRRIEKSSISAAKKIIGAGDGYASVYGDEDGNTDDAYEEVQMQTTQILRLRADQDSQSDVQSRLRLLTMNGGGAIADDLANRTLRGISASSKSEGFTLADKECKKLSAPSNFQEMVASNEPAPRFAGMQRLG